MKCDLRCKLAFVVLITTSVHLLRDACFVVVVLRMQVDPVINTKEQASLALGGDSHFTSHLERLAILSYLGDQNDLGHAGQHPQRIRELVGLSFRADGTPDAFGRSIAAVDLAGCLYGTVWPACTSICESVQK